MSGNGSISRECKQCGKAFFVHPSGMKRGRGVYCSRQCAGKATARPPHTPRIPYVCPQCGVTFHKKANEVKTANPFCSRSCVTKSRTGDQAAHWKGGKPRLSKTGYLIIQVDGRDVLEHRHVMEQNIGRLLTSKEIVHHIDGNGLNNNPNNLMLTTAADHRRLHKLTRWARKYDGCVICGTTERPHAARGHCLRCYNARRYGYVSRPSR